jgi:hypothetical protein
MASAHMLGELLPALLAALAIILGGCGIGSSSTGKSSVADNLFLSTVHLDAPDVNTYRSDLQLVRLGHAACDGFASGASYEELADRLPTTEGSHPLPPGDLGTVITAAVDAFCPQYHGDVT